MSITTSKNYGPGLIRRLFTRFCINEASTMSPRLQIIVTRFFNSPVFLIA